MAAKNPTGFGVPPLNTRRSPTPSSGSSRAAPSGEANRMGGPKRKNIKQLKRKFARERRVRLLLQREKGRT